MHRHTHHTRLEAQINDYAAALFRHVVRRLKARRPHDADDIAQRVCEVFLRQPLEIMAKYGDASRFAAAATRNAEVSFDRSQRAQRGEGVQLDAAADGSFHPRRLYVSGNAPIGGFHSDQASGEWFDRVTDAAEAFTDQVDDRVVTSQLLEQCLVGITATERELLWRIDGQGVPVVEVAAERRLARETVSRQMGRIRRRVQQNHAAMQRSPRSDQRPTT